MKSIVKSGGAGGSAAGRTTEFFRHAKAPAFRFFVPFVACLWGWRSHTPSPLYFHETNRHTIVGCGGVALQNHLPGLGLCPEAKLVALCDSDAATVHRASQQTGVAVVSTKFDEILGRDDVHAVIIATPNFTHATIALAAI